MDSNNGHDKQKFKSLGKYMNWQLGLPNFKEINGIIYKLCTRCKQYKPMSNEYFCPRNNVKCGYDSYCRECAKEKSRLKPRVKPFNEFGELYCAVCKTYKPITEFYKGEKNKLRMDYSRECKECEAGRKRIK